MLIYRSRKERSFARQVRLCVWRGLLRTYTDMYMRMLIWN